MTDIERNASQHARADRIHGAQAIARIELQRQFVIARVLGKLVGQAVAVEITQLDELLVLSALQTKVESGIDIRIGRTCPAVEKKGRRRCGEPDAGPRAV